MTIRHFVFLILCLAFSQNIYTQADTLNLDLVQVVVMAETGSPQAQIAETRLSNNYWRNQSFLADYKPQFTLTGNLPNFNRTIDPITLPDGGISFISRSIMNNNMGISLGQSIPQTGGRISATTGIRRIDIFNENAETISSYLSNPISINFIQPILGFNQMKWDRMISPLEYEEAKRGYNEEKAGIAYQATVRFFNVLIAQLNVEAAFKNKANADTLYQISESRYQVGKIAETELLQIELNARNAEADLVNSQFNLENSSEELRNFLGIQTATWFQLTPPFELPNYDVDAQLALDYARKYRSATVEFQRRVLEADQIIAQAKGETGFRADLFISFGLSQTSDKLGQSFQNLIDQEQVQVGITVPIADWGKTKARLAIADSNSELIRRQVEQDEVNFDREIIIKVQQFKQVRQQALLAQRSYDIALKRLDITRKRYRIGKIDVTDLNLAINEEANSRRTYINALRSFWEATYDLRRITLYDFENGRALIRE